jgi:hypothetical protein
MACQVGRKLDSVLVRAERDKERQSGGIWQHWIKIDITIKELDA